MKKVIRLTENDLVRIVKKVISEQTPPANLPWIGNDGKFIDNKGEVIKKLSEEMSEEESLEYYNYNILGGYFGEQNPIFLVISSHPHI